MPITVLFAAGALALSIPLLVWAVTGTRRPKQAVAENLSRGLEGPHDLRQILLGRNATERAVQPALRRVAGVTRRFTPSGLLDGLDRKIALAGSPSAWPLERVLAAKLLLGAAGAVFGVFLFSVQPTGRSALFAAVITVLAVFAPDLILSARARERQDAVQMALPDTLDQLTICMEAGLGFEAAMARAGRTGEGPLAEELIRTLQEMQIGLTRGQALRGLLSRTDVTELRRFVFALLQAESYGLPVADVLRTQAQELRVIRRQRAEERAMKVPVKVVFPLVLCILPALMIVVLGPAGIRIARFFGGG